MAKLNRTVKSPQFPSKPRISNLSESTSFTVWLSENTNLSDSSVIKYVSAVRTVSNEMLD